MGKVRVKTIGDDELELKEKKEQKQKKEAKIAEKKAVVSEEQFKSPEIKEVETEVKETKKTKSYKKKSEKKAKVNPHSKSYLATKTKIDKNKVYSISEGIKLLKELKRAKFDETVELHLTMSEMGVSGKLTLPHGTGKKMRIAIATDELIEQIEKGLPASADAQASGRRGKINFDILVADPSMMPKLAKVAKILGPKGLMPNPKNGTITNDPQALVKKYEGGQINFKTEAKAPIIHFTVGKISFEDKKLAENINTILKAVKKEQIKKITLSSTMSPSIRLTA